jgi:hypothetical protein
VARALDVIGQIHPGCLELGYLVALIGQGLQSRGVKLVKGLFAATRQLLEWSVV